MASSDPTDAVVLNDNARFVLYRMVELQATDIGEAVEHAKTSHDLEVAVARAERHLAKMRVAETGALPAALVPALSAEIAAWRAEALEQLDEHCASRDKWRSGDRGHGFDGYGLSADETEAEFRRMIDGELDEVAGCDAFLEAVA